MELQTLFTASHAKNAEEFTWELERVLTLLMDYYGNNPIGDEGEACEIAHAHRVMSNTVRYFRQFD